MNVDYITIEPQEFDPEEGAYTPDGECFVYGHGTYPNYSVLAQRLSHSDRTVAGWDWGERRTFLGSFPCLSEACLAYPDAEVGQAFVQFVDQPNDVISCTSFVDR